MELKRNLAVLTLVVFTFVFLSVAVVSAVSPNGATITAGTPSTATSATAENNSAIAGNITELTITSDASTQAWQGYFGNVSGSIQLADSSGNALYNWSLANPSGEVYASTNSSITWANVQCLNFTATGSQVGDTSGGGTSLNGTNLTTLETQFNIATADPDGVDETFTFLGAGTHDAFYTASQEFTQGECQSTRVYGSSGATSDEFEEVLLYEPASTSIIFASILESGSVNGFDSNDHDFEMLVLEDGHGVDVSTTTYYFFVELE